MSSISGGPNIFSVGVGDGTLYVVPSGLGLSTITIPYLMNSDRSQPRYTKLRDVEVHVCEASGSEGLNRSMETFPES